MPKTETTKKMEDIKKGPWKSEEDEVLVNHVKRYGPRDWSSIRSKGLLQRTGKSCRLRWVNKLRPNLKIGCKFSVEEERTVIELQSEFGNKWARIATYLPGRTDNDVKNFWSSRQKRLARILHNSDASSSSSSFNPKSSSSSKNRTKGKTVKPLRYSFNPSQGFGLVEEENVTDKMIPLPESSSDQVVVDEALGLPELGVKLEHQPFTFGTDLVLAETATTTTTSSLFSPESRELLARLDDPYFYDILGATDSSEPLFSLPHQPFFQPSPTRRSRHVSKDEDDVFLDDFPADMFDQIDPIRDP